MVRYLRSLDPGVSEDDKPEKGQVASTFGTVIDVSLLKVEMSEEEDNVEQ